MSPTKHNNSAFHAIRDLIMHSYYQRNDCTLLSHFSSREGGVWGCASNVTAHNYLQSIYLRTCCLGISECSLDLIIIDVHNVNMSVYTFMSDGRLETVYVVCTHC